MRFRPVLVALLTIPFATAPAAAVATGVSHGATSPAGGKQSDPVLPDGIPAGVTIPAGAGQQAFEFGRCASRVHSPGGWVCSEDGSSAMATMTRNRHRRPRAHAAAYYRYHFNDPRNTYWGVGAVLYGTIFWERAGNFNGATHDVWQAGTVTDGAHTVRYHFHNVAWRLTSTGAQYRDAFSEWGNNSCTRRRVRQTTWPHHHTSGHDYYMEIYFHLRDCAVNNPDTPGGMWYSPIYKTKVYHCVDSTGNCYFKGY